MSVTAQLPRERRMSLRMSGIQRIVDKHYPVEPHWIEGGQVWLYKDELAVLAKVWKADLKALDGGELYYWAAAPWAEGKGFKGYAFSLKEAKEIVERLDLQRERKNRFT